MSAASWVLCTSASRRRTSCKNVGMVKNKKCEHGRQRFICKDCGGSGICEHGRRRTQCKDCGGGSICEHGRERRYCKDCGGSSICVHGRRRSQCKDCGGGSVCEHGRMRWRCKDCGEQAQAEVVVRAAAEICKQAELVLQQAQAELGSGEPVTGERAAVEVGRQLK